MFMFTHIFMFSHMPMFTFVSMFKICQCSHLCQCSHVLQRSRICQCSKPIKLYYYYYYLLLVHVAYFQTVRSYFFSLVKSDLMLSHAFRLEPFWIYYLLLIVNQTLKWDVFLNLHSNRLNKLFLRRNNYKQFLSFARSFSLKQETLNRNNPRRIKLDRHEYVFWSLICLCHTVLVIYLIHQQHALTSTSRD